MRASYEPDLEVVISSRNALLSSSISYEFIMDIRDVHGFDIEMSEADKRRFLTTGCIVRAIRNVLPSN